MPLIAIEGDLVEQDACHDPTPSGGGSYPVSPVTLQDFVFIAGKKVIPKGQDYPAHETGYAGTLGGSSFVFVAGIPHGKGRRPGDALQLPRGPPHRRLGTGLRL